MELWLTGGRKGFEEIFLRLGGHRVSMDRGIDLGCFHVDPEMCCSQPRYRISGTRLMNVCPCLVQTGYMQTAWSTGSGKGDSRCRTRLRTLKKNPLLLVLLSYEHDVISCDHTHLNDAICWQIVRRVWCLWSRQLR